MKYSIERVATLIGAHPYGDDRATISLLLTDSRSLCFPEETLFFAIRTKRDDGHRYIEELYRRGVRNFVVERLPAGHAATMSEACFLVVADTLTALQRLAERHRDEFDIPVVGITGSNGKTVVKEWLYRLLSGRYRVTRSPRSYNSQIGVPLSVWLLDTTSEVALFEAGISMPGEMDALRTIIQPDVAVITNIGQAHQENFRSTAEKCREKIRLLHDAATAVYCADDRLIAREIRASHFAGEALAWSAKDPYAPMYLEKITKGETSTTVEYVFKGTRGSYTLPFIDDASIRNTATCATVALSLGLPAAVLSQRMTTLEPVAMRLEVKEGRRGCTLINDTYNSDINSLDIALDFMARRTDRRERRRTLVLSDILQSGASPERLYGDVSELAAKRGVDKLIGIGADITAQGEHIAVPEKHFFPTCEAFLASEEMRRLHDEVILIKGARSFGFDRITDALVEKVHETTLEVDLNALVANLNHYRSLLRPSTKMACMIKADGYGAGAVEIAKTLQEHRVDYLAVAVADEGATLRRNGITVGIMVMNPELSAFKTLFDYDLEPEVYSFRLLDALIAAAQREGMHGVPIHLKLDTGMARLGFCPETDVDALIERLRGQDAVTPRSVFSHFVGSDSGSFDAFSEQQFARFDAASGKIQNAFEHRILRHMDNTAAITRFPERQLDLCRLGIGLYGVDPVTGAMLSNVSTLRTTILQKRTLAAGTSVGYSRRTVLDRDSVVAAIPIGYADGLDRHLGNRHGYCIVNGRQAPYVGNICMDVAMIDVTDIACDEGDSVEIFGPQLPVTVLAEQLGTIAYEVLTGISNRVRRVYFQD